MKHSTMNFNLVYRNHSMKTTRDYFSDSYKPIYIKSENGNGLRGLFETELKEIYWTEKALTRLIPKMINNAASPDLVKVLNNHFYETEEQITRLEDAFINLGLKAKSVKSGAMECILRECENIIDKSAKGPVRDAAIISANQKIEHFEIASYSSLCSFARTLCEEEVFLLLEETLNEEKYTNNLLTRIGESSINMQAAY